MAKKISQKKLLALYLKNPTLAQFIKDAQQENINFETQKNLNESVKVLSDSVRKPQKLTVESENKSEMTTAFFEMLRGQDGYSPQKGVDYFTQDEIKAFLALSTPQKGVDYFTQDEVRDFLNAVRPKVGVDYFTQDEISNLMKMITPQKGVDYLTETEIQKVKSDIKNLISKENKMLFSSFENNIQRTIQEKFTNQEDLSFVSLSDTPNEIIPNKIFGTDANGKIIFIDLPKVQEQSGYKMIGSRGGFPNNFIGLIDTPSTYTDNALKFVRVNAAGTGLEFVANSGGDSLPDQTGQNGKFLTTDGTNPSWASIPGGGDMLASVYDPQNISADAFDRANHTGTQTASTISDFDTEVSNNTDVAANTAARHSAVTLAGVPDYITIAGQTITRALINLASHVTGRLPFANLPTGTAHTVVTKATAGNGDLGLTTMGNDTILGRSGSGNVDALSATQVRTILNVEDGANNYTNEMAQDAVGGILTDTDTIDFTYNDVANTITADVKPGSITNNEIASETIRTGNIADGQITEAKLSTTVNASLDLADTSLQPSDIGTTVQGYSAVLAGTTASFTTADETKLDGIEAGATANPNAIDNLVEDTTPQLGGTLDANGFGIDMGVNTITDTAVGNWNTAFGWGDHATEGYLTNVALNDISNVTLTAPSNGEVLKYNGTIWVNAPDAGAGGGISNLIEDTTPQLGGNLDVNGFEITSNTGGDVTVRPDGAGRFEVYTGTADLCRIEMSENILLQAGVGNGVIVSALGGDIQLNTLSGLGTIAINGAVTVTGTVDGRDVATDGTKLDGIENGADVTDVTNVTASLVPTSTSSDEVSFVIPRTFGTPASPRTANITESLTGAQAGIVQIIYHNSGTAPTFPAGWQKLGTGDYVTGELNLIFCTWVSGTLVHYWIVQYSA